MTIQELKAELRGLHEVAQLNHGLLDALKRQRQIDMDGEEVGVNRQAVDEAIERLEALAYVGTRLPAMVEHVEGLERDARRYRWLVESDSLERPSVTLGEAYQKYTGGMLDAAIDREMGALAEQGEKVS